MLSPITRNRIFGATSPVRGAKRGPRRQNETLVLRLARELVTQGERSAAALWRAEPRTAWLRAPRRRGERERGEGVVDEERVGRRRRRRERKAPLTGGEKGTVDEERGGRRRPGGGAGEEAAVDEERGGRCRGPRRSPRLRWHAGSAAPRSAPGGDRRLRRPPPPPPGSTLPGAHQPRRYSIRAARSSPATLLPEERGERRWDEAAERGREGERGADGGWQGERRRGRGAPAKEEVGVRTGKG